MKIKLQIIIESDDGQTETIQEVASLARGLLQPAELGLTLMEAKSLLEGVQRMMVKKQQMRWSKRGAHLLLQVRTKVLNEELRETFDRWYPSSHREIEEQKKAA